MDIPLEEAVEIINSGGIVAVPTETVYGLAASINHPSAIQKIFSIKGRPVNNPLIIHVSSQQQVEAFVDSFPKDFELLAKKFWPGPLTLVVPVIEDAIPKEIRAGLPTAAFRVPNHVLAQGLISKAGPIVMPSANLSGKPSSTEPKHIEHDFGEDFPVLSGGVCDKGIESTVLIFTEDEWTIGRLGGIAAEDIEKVIGYRPSISNTKDSKNPLCPGQMYRHYAPNATLYVGKNIPEECTIVIGFKEREYPPSKNVKILGSIRSPEEVAKSLYQLLREIDSEGVEFAWIDCDFPETGLWVSIKERILKASQ